MGNNNSIVLLVTAVNRHKGTQSITEYSGIFAVNRNGLDEVEKDVFDMVRAYPDCWTCGTVTGYPESLLQRKKGKLSGSTGLANGFHCKEY